MKKLDIPTWTECSEKLHNIERADRTVEEAVINGSELTPLEAVIYDYEEVDEKRSEEFIAAIKRLAEWCINNPDHVLSQHEAL